MVCKRVVYSGHVQGVGFRYTAQRLASGFAVSGYVKNLPTGEVELVAQGEPDEVDRFLERIAERMRGYVAEANITAIEPQQFEGFEIRF